MNKHIVLPLTKILREMSMADNRMHGAEEFSVWMSC